MAKGKMKAWYDDIDAATLQRIKTYSAFNDATSKNLMMQTMYEYREKEIQDFKETNHELAENCIARKKRIAELEKELEKELKEEIKNNEDLATVAYMQGAGNQKKKSEEQLARAREILRGLYFIIQSRIDYEKNTGIADEMWRAEQFLEEN